MTVFFTIFAGVTVFVLGQIIMRFFVDPIIELKQVIGEINDCLILNANIYNNPPKSWTKELSEKRTQISHDTRKTASQLLAKMAAIPFYSKLEKLKIVPTQKAIYEAHGEILGLSNSCFSTAGGRTEVVSRYEKIEKALNIILDTKT